MVALLAKRLASMVVIVFALTAVIFYLQHISPLDPVHAQLGGQASAEAVAQQRHVLGLDRPILDAVLALPRRAAARRPRHLLPHPPPGVAPTSATILPATAELALAGAGDRRLSSASFFAFATTLRWHGVGRLPVHPADGCLDPDRSCSASAAFSSSTATSAGCRPADAPASRMHPPGPTGLLTIDGLLHGRFNVVVGCDPASDPAGDCHRARSGGRDRPGAAIKPDRRSAQRLRPDRPGQGSRRMRESSGGTCCATASARRCR